MILHLKSTEKMGFPKRDESATSITPPLSEAGGYVVVIVVGLVFAFGMSLIY